MDVDGTLTDGRVVYVGDLESQSFCVRDGQGLVWLRRAGVRLAWITGRGSRPTLRRARELAVEAFRWRSGDKGAVLEEIQAELGVLVEETIAMGDDVPDLAMARRAALFAAPADACGECRERADLVTSARAGAGAVRELAEAILRAKGEWERIVGEARG